MSIHKIYFISRQNKRQSSSFEYRINIFSIDDIIDFDIALNVNTEYSKRKKKEAKILRSWLSFKRDIDIARGL